jgi:hypothetical protein
MIVWRTDPEFWAATRAEHAFVKGYELVAFDIPATPEFPQRVIGWEVWPPQTKISLGPPEEYARRLQESMDDNDAFDTLIETLEADRSIKREGMRQIASAILGYEVPKSRGRAANINDIRHRQSFDPRRWAERMNKLRSSDTHGLEKGSSSTFEEAKAAAEAMLRKLLEA